MLRHTPRAVVALALMACSSSSFDGRSSGDGAPAFDEARSSLSRADATAPSQANAFVDANASFAVELLRQTASPDGNALTSPHSISLALAMSYAGANGTTKDEMRSALHFELPDADLHAAFNWLDQQVESRGAGAASEGGKDAKVSMQNAIFGSREIAFETPFLDTLAEDYGAGVKLADFETDPDGSTEKINDWVSAETAGRIDELLLPGAVTEDTRVVLVNTVYISSAWSTAFSSANTRPTPFSVNGQPVDVPTMHLGDAELGYAEDAKAQVVELPLAARGLAFDVILPAADLASYEASLDGATLQTLLRSVSSAEVTLALPKFELSPPTSVSLRDALKALGMRQAFERGADFTAMAKSAALFIDNVVHKAFLKIDEDGLEAAAATAVVMGDDSAFVAPRHTVNVDRPFLVVLRDTITGEILFLGHVVDPR